MQVLVSGANGQLGQCFKHLEAESSEEIDWHFYGRDEMDVLQAEDVAQKIKETNADIFINAAAYTAVDLAEEEREKAFAVNAHAVVNIGEICAAQGVHLIQISSDYVYHNAENRPLKEGSPTTPKGVYAQSKLAGEVFLADSDCHFTVIRTSWLYSPFANNFMLTMLRLLDERDELSVVYDQIGCPTSGIELARFIQFLLRKGLHKKQRRETLNFTQCGICSWYDFTRQIGEEAGLQCEIHPILSKDYPTPAPRPPYSVLNIEKLLKTYGYEPVHWMAALRECLNIHAALS